MEMEAKSGEGDDVQQHGGGWKRRPGLVNGRWEPVHELLEAGLIDDMTEAILPKRDIDVVQVLPI